MAKRTCSIEGCGKPENSRGWCSMHLSRWRRHGHPLATRRDKVNRYGTTELGTPRLVIVGPGGRERVVLFDAADEDVVRSRGWHVNDSGYVVSFICDGDDRHVIRLHRLILGLATGDETVVDHINGDRLDNQRHNLRLVPPRINGANRQVINCVGSSDFRGVSWDKAKGKWAAYVKVNYRKRSLGRYATEDEAAAVVAAFRRAHGLPPGY